MEKDELLEFVLNMGKALLENGAEAYRVEDTILRILNSLDLEDCCAFATTTGLFVSIGDTTKLKRITSRCINLSKIADINNLSREVVSKNITLEDAKNSLSFIKNNNLYSNTTVTISIGIACFFFSLLFRGSFSDAISSLIVGCLLNLFNIFICKKNISSFLVTCTGGIFVAIISLINLNIGIGKDIDNVIISSVMPLVPGVCFTVAIRDIFEGDYISGSSRLFEAVVIGVGIALGVGIVLSSWMTLFGSFLI